VEFVAAAPASDAGDTSDTSDTHDIPDGVGEVATSAGAVRLPGFPPEGAGRTVTTLIADEGDGVSVDWASIVGRDGTIVVGARVGHSARVVERLLDAGLRSDAPAVVLDATARRSIDVAVAADLRHADRTGVLVLGAAALADPAWFATRPLFGRRVVVTRARHQASRLAERLRAVGATTVSVPTISIVDPADGGAALRAAVADIGVHDWVIVSSPNGAERLLAAVRDGRDLAGCRLAVMGPGTAEVFAAHHLVPDLVPDRFLAESMLEAFPLPGPQDRGRVLLPRAAVARDVLPDGLRAMGWRVDVVDAYRTVPVVPTDDERRLVRDADVVTFTSASTVDNWVAAFGAEQPTAMVACIGPVTADAARRAGLRIDVIAETHTIDGLVGAVVARLAGPATEARSRRRGSSRPRFGRSRPHA